MIVIEFVLQHAGIVTALLFHVIPKSLLFFNYFFFFWLWPWLDKWVSIIKNLLTALIFYCLISEGLAHPWPVVTAQVSLCKWWWMMLLITGRWNLASAYFFGWIPAFWKCNLLRNNYSNVIYTVRKSLGFLISSETSMNDLPMFFSFDD